MFPWSLYRSSLELFTEAVISSLDKIIKSVS